MGYTFGRCVCVWGGREGVDGVAVVEVEDCEILALTGV